MGLRDLVARSRVLVEDLVLTSPQLNFRPRLTAVAGQEVRRLVGSLEEHGCAAIGSVLSDRDLRDIRSSIAQAVQGQRTDIAIAWSEKVQYTQVLNPLRLHPRLFELSVHPPTLAVAESYFRRQPYLSDVDLRRIDAVSMDALGRDHLSSSNWHRDMRGRQLKLMVYLSDVSESDSNFSLIPGSHHGHYVRKKTYLESRFRDTDIANRSTFEWYGRAGEAMLFDTNVIHRLRRRAGARVRDSITYYYTPGQSLFALDYPTGSLEALPEQGRAVFGDPGWPLSRQPSG